MTVATTQTETQLFHISVIIFLTQSHSTLMRMSHLSKFFTIVVAEIRLLNYSCCRIGDLASFVSLAQK